MSPAMSKIYGLILQQIPDSPDREWTLGPDDHFLTAVPFLGLHVRIVIVFPSLGFLGFLELPSDFRLIGGECAWFQSISVQSQENMRDSLCYTPLYMYICTCVCMYMCMYENLRYFLVDMGLWVMLSYPFTTCSPSPSIPLQLGFIKFLGFFVKTS